MSKPGFSVDRCLGDGREGARCVTGEGVVVLFVVYKSLLYGIVSSCLHKLWMSDSQSSLYFFTSVYTSCEVPSFLRGAN